MNESALIVLDNSALSSCAGNQALLLKEEALTAAAVIGRVSTAEENIAAAAAQSKLADFRRQIEKARVAAKAPFLELGKKIDDTAKSLVSDINDEELRISKLCGDFHQLQEAKRIAAEKVARLEAEAIEQRRIAEERRILREAAEKEAVARAEAKALQVAQDAERAAAERKIREAKDAESRARAEREAAIQKEHQERAAVELQRQQELAAAKTHDELDKAQERASNAQAAIVVAPVAPVKVAGQNVKADVRIISIDLPTLYRFHANCVKLEPLEGEIKAILMGGGIVKGVVSEFIMKAQAGRSRLEKFVDV